MFRWWLPLIVLLIAGGASKPFGSNLLLTATVAITALFMLGIIHMILTRGLAGARGGETTIHPFAAYLMLAVAGAVIAAFALLLSNLHPALLALLVAAMAVPVTQITFQQHLRRRRIDSGLCAECGYDLRATEERCPECNTLVSEEQLRRRRIRAELRAAREAVASAPADDQ